MKIAGRTFTLKKSLLEDLEGQDPGNGSAACSAALLVMHSPRDTGGGDRQCRRHLPGGTAPEELHLPRPCRSPPLPGGGRPLRRGDDRRLGGAVPGNQSRRRPTAEAIDNRVTARSGPQGFYTDLFVNGHALAADEPESYGGSGLAPSPYDYLLAALGACTGMTVQMYARRKQWPLEAAVVRLRHEKIHAEDCEHCAENGGKIDRFERELELQGELSVEQRRRLMEIAEKCPVHRTLHSEVKIESWLKEDGGEV